MRIPCPVLALLSLTVAAFAQQAQPSDFLGRNGQPTGVQSGSAQSTFAAAAPEVRRAEPVTRAATAVPANLAPIPGGGGGAAVLRTGDSFDLRMTGMPTEDANMYALTFTIGGDGMVNIPLGGQIRAAGLTQSQLEKSIQTLLMREKIFTHPTAIINLPNQARFVTVGGEVRSPNRQPWAPDLTLLTAVTAAGGPGDFGGDKVDLIRNGTKTQYSLKKLNRNPIDDPKLMPGDRLDLH